MTVSQLIDKLWELADEVGGDAEVRIAYRGGYDEEVEEVYVNEEYGGVVWIDSTLLVRK